MKGLSLAEKLSLSMPDLRGRLRGNALLSEITWFRVGGAAELLFMPADEADLSYFLHQAPKEIPLTIIGLGSNLLVRDGGIPGITVRLGRGFMGLSVEGECHLRVGAAVPDRKIANAAADAGISGLTFYRGIPGGLGGALRMNAGAHGTETRDLVVEVRALDRAGKRHLFSNADMKYDYRHSGLPEDYIFTEAVLCGTPGDRDEIHADMEEVSEYRQTKQPIKSRTGGSTFKNPPGERAWKLIDAAGCRGLAVGGAHVSELHCNFLINEEGASADDLEELGELVRTRVRDTSGIELQWEIRRLGIFASEKE